MTPAQAGGGCGGETKWESLLTSNLSNRERLSENVNVSKLHKEYIYLKICFDPSNGFQRSISPADAGRHGRHKQIAVLSTTLIERFCRLRDRGTWACAATGSNLSVDIFSVEGEWGVLEGTRPPGQTPVRGEWYRSVLASFFWGNHKVSWEFVRPATQSCLSWPDSCALTTAVNVFHLLAASRPANTPSVLEEGNKGDWIFWGRGRGQSELALFLPATESSPTSSCYRQRQPTRV